MDRIIELNTTIIAAASAVGKKEHEGPLGSCFDIHDEEDRYGQPSWEKCESAMQRAAMNIAIKKSGIKENEIEAIFDGDLLNQCTGSSYGMLGYEIPYFGLYGACSTAAEGIMLASIMTTHGVFRYAAAVTSSHFCSAERQYRTPVEYGSQRAPTAQWTVTGAGAFIIGPGGKVRVTAALPGIVREKGIKDASNMGAAMAPAAAETILRYVILRGGRVDDLDLVVTGDLGYEGNAILQDLLGRDRADICDRLADCGMMIYDRARQDVHSGGSGCGCSAVVLASYLLPKLESRELKKIVLVGTGALMSPLTLQQGEGIPAIAHLIELQCAE
ncbi:MAG: stage V sporulation protein AD [Clostridiales bacterium]|nr:stage V sporulation protein AD [Clostridiales bacterium]